MASLGPCGGQIAVFASCLQPGCPRRCGRHGAFWRQNMAGVPQSRVSSASAHHAAL